MTEEQFKKLNSLSQKVCKCEHNVNEAAKIWQRIVVRENWFFGEHIQVDLFNIPSPVIENFANYYLEYTKKELQKAEREYAEALNDFQYVGKIQYGSGED